jgi:hypothetical protein
MSHLKLDFLLVGAAFCLGAFVGMQSEVQPLIVNRPILAPNVEPVRVPFPICFGRTIYGPVTLKDVTLKNSPLLIVGSGMVGDGIHISGVNIIDADVGIYMMEPGAFNKLNKTIEIVDRGTGVNLFTQHGR